MRTPRRDRRLIKLRRLVEQPGAGAGQQPVFVLNPHRPVGVEQKWQKLAFYRAWAFTGILQVPVSEPVEEQAFGQTKDIPQPSDVILDQPLTGGLIIQSLVIVDLGGVKRDQGVEQGERSVRFCERGKSATYRGWKPGQRFGLECDRIGFGYL